jgi:hypothetical protein
LKLVIVHWLGDTTVTVRATPASPPAGSILGPAADLVTERLQLGFGAHDGSALAAGAHDQSMPAITRIARR